MALVKILTAGSALFAAVLAQGVSFTEWPTSVTAGQPATLKWVGGTDAPATITLRKGAATNLGDVEVLTSDATNGEYTWTPSTDLQNGNDYAFQISQGDQVNYSGLVSLGGGSDMPPPAASDSRIQQTDSMSTATASATESADATTTMSGVEESTTGLTTSGPTETASAPTTSGPESSSSTSSSGSESLSSTDSKETSSPTVVARPSLMNTPFNAAKDASSTASASSSMQTDSAGRITAPLTLGAGLVALLLLVQ